MFHMSKVTPECMPPTRGDFGHNPFFNSKGSLDIMSIHMGLLYLCEYYTTPEINKKKSDKRRHEKRAR